jgi:short-subunit dehydrogenase
LHKGVHVMWVSPGFTASSIRQHALNASASPQGESPLDEKSLMSAPECALRILQAIEHKKRTVVMTLDGKKTVWLNKFWPGLADRLVYRFFYKNGALIK